MMMEHSHSKVRYASFIYFEIIYILYLKLFIDVAKVPNMAWYLCDAINIFLLMKGITKNRVFSHIRAKKFLDLIIILFLFSICGFFINSVNPLLYFWGLRNLGRMFVFWYVCIVFLTRDDLIRILKCFYIAFYINFVLAVVQYASGIKGDNLGGIFGISGASSALTLNLLVIVSALVVCGYIHNKVNLGKMVIVLLMAMVLAPLAELKAYYFVFAVIVLVALAMAKKLTPKIIMIIIGGGVGLYVAVRIMMVVYPESLRYLSIEGMQRYLSSSNGIGYSSIGDLSRTEAISQLYKMFFQDDPLRAVFGFGLGSCEMSNFALFTSPFFLRYEYLHYRWFFDAMLYLEMGAGGLLLYSVFAIMLLQYTLKKARAISDDMQSLTSVSVIIVAYTFFLAVYNSALRIEAGYFVWFMLAIPLILVKTGEENGRLAFEDIFQIGSSRIKIH